MADGIKDSEIKLMENGISSDLLDLIEEVKEENESNQILNEDKAKKEEHKKELTKEEKQERDNFVKIIERLKEDLVNEPYEPLEQIYSQYLNNEDITKRNIKEGTNKIILFIMYFIISPAFGIINLIGVFQSISIMKIIFKILNNALYNFYLFWTSSDVKPLSINQFIEQYDFYKMLNNNTKKESFDFNLIMLMAFLGDILLKSKGFRISTLIFACLNILSMFLINNFSFEDYNHKNNSYSLFQILFLLLCWILLFIGVGASALLSQQIIIDSNNKYDAYKKELNEKKKKKKEEWSKYFEKKENHQDESSEMKTVNSDKDQNNKIKNEGVDNDNINIENKDLIFNNINDKKNHENEKQNIKEKSLKDMYIDIHKDISDLNKSERKKRLSKSSLPPSILPNDKNNKIVVQKDVKKYENKKKINQNKLNSFFMICIITIIGYFLKYILNIFLLEEIEKYERNDMPNLKNIINEGNDKIKCGLDYNCFDNFFNDTNLTNSNNQLFNNLILRVRINDDYEFYILLIIYASSIILSIILYSIFICIFIKNEKNENEKVYKVCQICGYLIYSEDRIIKKDPPFCECCKLLCGTFKNCFNMILESLLSCLNGNENNENDINYDFSSNEKNDDKYKKNKECFCYCYQVKRKQYWFNEFITSEIQKKIFPYMLEYFLLQFLTIAFEKQYYEIPIIFFKTNYKNETDYNDNKYEDIQGLSYLKKELLFNFLVFILTFFLFFYLTLSFNRLEIIFKGSTTIEENNVINKLSKRIIEGSHVILFFNGIYSFILSSYYLAQNDADIFQYHYLILVPILMNKFFYFTLIYHCIGFAEMKKKFDLISGSTLISIYLIIWDLIVSFIRDISSLNGLYITQLVISIFPCLAIFMFIWHSKSKFENRLSCLFCFFSVFLCFGGFWLEEENLENISKCKCCKNINCCYCNNSLIKCNCLDSISRLPCCKCCFGSDCYD